MKNPNKKGVMVSIFIVVAIFFVLSLSVSAFSGTSTNYNVTSYHHGSSGNTGSSTNYNLTFTGTYEQGGTSNASSVSYSLNAGWYGITADTVPPSVFDLLPVANSSFNVSDVIEIAANVTDDIAVSVVLANVTYPNGTINQLTLSLVTGSKYNNSFTIPALVGQYNITFIANDTDNNINRSETTFFVGVDQIAPSVFNLIPVANTT